MKSICRLVLPVTLLIVMAPFIYAHDPGLSYVEMKSEGQRLSVSVTFSEIDLKSLIGSTEDQERFDRLMDDGIIIRMDGTRIIPNLMTSRREQSNAIRFDLTFDMAAGKELSFESALMSRLPFGHKQFLTVAANDVRIEDKLLSASDNRYETGITRLHGQNGRRVVFFSFLGLGIEHIMLGFDHLAFLAALLLGGGGFRGAMKIVTAFTVAHSMTLALCVFNVINLPGSIIEPVIAGSIIYVALENLLKREIGNRWAPAFGFGLIHGFGFATVLREMGIAQTGSGAVLPLLSFNFGVEIGQIGLTALALPAIIAIRNRPVLASRLIPACSLLLTFSGLVWLIQRIWM